MNVFSLRRIIFFILSLLSFTASLTAQQIPDSTRTRIDALFKEWDNTNSPGCALGIVKGDSLVFAKGYGMANLEYGVPNTPSTMFQLASVSKQFTAYCIVLLARQGKLNLEDDIHKYLPRFPDLNETITIRNLLNHTIRNLLNHTSGIRDYLMLRAIEGKKEEDIITQKEVLSLLYKQQALNFKPNEKFLYSNSNYILLAEIVKKVSGQSFRQFVDSAIFKPLKMEHSHIHDDYSEIIKGRSYSYAANDDGSFSNIHSIGSDLGSTGLFTTGYDFGKWISNYFHPVAGVQQDIEQLTGLKGKLTNGEEQVYALGVRNTSYAGQQVITHNGSSAGYRTGFLVFPNIKLGIFLFSNIASLPVDDRIHNVADIFLKKQIKKIAIPEPAENDTSKAILLNPLLFKKYMGSYVDELGTLFRFSMQDNKIHWQGNGVSRLMKAEGDTITIFPHTDSKMVFSINPEKHDTVLKQFWSDNQRIFYKIRPDNSFTDQQLKAYEGTYYSPELDCRYYVKLRNHHLYLYMNKPEESIILFRTRDDLVSEFWWFPSLKINRTAKGHIEGFEVNAGRVQHLRFTKTE
ncbi:MAG: serine hydrolase domain-containing protein [Bacteroidia bacterium]